MKDRFFEVAQVFMDLKGYNLYEGMQLDFLFIMAITEDLNFKGKTSIYRTRKNGCFTIELENTLTGDFIIFEELENY